MHALLALCHAATTIPSLDAESSLHVLADLLLESGFKNGLVTAEHHDKDRARQRYLAAVFVYAWRKLCNPSPNYTLPYRLSGPVEEIEAWVELPEIHLKIYDADNVRVFFAGQELRDIMELLDVRRY